MPGNTARYRKPRSFRFALPSIVFMLRGPSINRRETDELANTASAIIRSRWDDFSEKSRCLPEATWQTLPINGPVWKAQALTSRQHRVVCGSSSLRPTHLISNSYRGLPCSKGRRMAGSARACCLLAMLGTTGCHSVTTAPASPSTVLAAQAPGAPTAMPFGGEVPIEKSKVILPPYRIEPPDILFIDAVKVVPKAPYRISPQDTLQIRAAGTLADQPINGPFRRRTRRRH